MDREKKDYLWSRFYQSNQEYLKPQEAYKRIFSRIGRKFNKGVDLGCGKGRHLPLLKSICHMVDGLDSQDYHVDVNCFYQSDIKIVGWRPEAYDLIFSNGLLHHFEKEITANIIGRIQSNMTIGSYFVFNLHSKNDYKYRVGEMISKDSYIYDAGSEKDQVHSFWEKSEIIRLLSRCSVKEIFEEGSYGYACWYAVAEKA